MVKAKDALGDRMKNYEDSYRLKLPKRMPVIIRIDGKSFHTYTRGMKKPFDLDLTNAMWETAKYLAANIAGCKLAYHQSDEISLLITNYDKLTTESWFDNNLQKMVSVSASLATAKFNEIMKEKYPEKPLALFDARAFILSINEVNNYFLWRQNDASKNSISMVAQSLFSHSSLQHLSGAQMQDKLMLEKGINWNDLDTWKKRGACVIKKKFQKSNVIRSKWDIDLEIPIFSKEPSYINKLIQKQID